MKKLIFSPVFVVTTLCLVLLFCFQSCKKETLTTASSSASTASVPPKTRGYYKLLPNLSSNFIYYNQLTPISGATQVQSYYPGNGCLAASCMMGAHYMNPFGSNMIPCNTTNYVTYCAGMGVVQGGAAIGPSNPSAYYYLKNNVWSSQLQNQAQPPNTSGRTATIAAIKTYLNNNRPVVARIWYKQTTGSKGPVSSGNSNTVGHFVLIVGLSETSVGTGTVYCYDPLNNGPGYKSWDWNTFLNSMTVAVSGVNKGIMGTSNYNFMRIGYN